MSDVVLAALIGAIASIIVNLITASNQRKKRAIEDALKDERLRPGSGTRRNSPTKPSPRTSCRK